MTSDIDLKDAVERYLNERRGDLSDSSHYNYGSQLRQFIAWCEAENDRREKAVDIDGWHISDFKVHWRDEDKLADTSLYNQMSVLRVFVRWCESRDLLEGLSADMMMPTSMTRRETRSWTSRRGSRFYKDFEPTTTQRSVTHCLRFSGPPGCASGQLARWTLKITTARKCTSKSSTGLPRARR